MKYPMEHGADGGGVAAYHFFIARNRPGKV